jgi:hypothetical protein
VSSREELQRIFDEAISTFASSNREQLSYEQMLNVAAAFDEWAEDERLTLERSAQLLGWAEGLRRLAVEVGPEWHPVEPDKLNLLGLMARKIEHPGGSI